MKEWKSEFVGSQRAKLRIKNGAHIGYTTSEYTSARACKVAPLATYGAFQEPFTGLSDGDGTSAAPCNLELDPLLGPRCLEGLSYVHGIAKSMHDVHFFGRLPVGVHLIPLPYPYGHAVLIASVK